jgi:hypothetical protein
MVRHFYSLSHNHETLCTIALYVSVNCVHFYVGCSSKMYAILDRENIVASLQHIRNVSVFH